MGVESMNRLLAVALASTMPLFSLTGCFAPESPREQVRSIDCPSDVEAVVLPPHSCGYVDLDDGTSLFIVRVQPPESPTSNPVVELGTDLGTTPDYGGLVAVAQRTGRELVMVDMPGVGHSTPLLSCPEVDELSATLASTPDPASARLIEAIGACRQRTEEVVDIASTAEALHDLVEALDLDKVVAMSHGTSGRVGLEWAALHPTDLEALVLDTPLVADSDPIDRVDALVHDIAGACAAQRPCRRSHPDLFGEWQSAVASYGESALTVPVDGTDVTIGPDQLRRAVLWVAGGSPRSQGLPELINDASQRSRDGILGRYAAALVQGPPQCAGYLPKCAGAPKVAMGALLSLYCPALVHDPTWAEPCRAWESEGDEALPDGITVPTLVLTGRYDPFAPPAEVRRILRDVVPAAFYIEDPAGGHNVLGVDCLRDVRNLWLADDVHQAPTRPPCLEDRVIPFPESHPPS